MAGVSLTPGRESLSRLSAGRPIACPKTHCPSLASKKFTTHMVQKLGSNSRENPHPFIPRPVHFSASPVKKTAENLAGKIQVQAPERELMEEDSLPRRLEWFNKNKELWIEPLTVGELDSTIRSEPEKFVFVDFFAGWCSSCKAAYPALCKIAQNPDFIKNFKFVKVDVQRAGIASYIRKLGIRGIPMIVVFGPGGEKLTQFGGSFRKMNMVKANLVTMGANKGSEFITDPNGFVFPRPE